MRWWGDDTVEGGPEDVVRPAGEEVANVHYDRSWLITGTYFGRFSTKGKLSRERGTYDGSRSVEMLRVRVLNFEAADLWGSLRW